MAGLVVLGVLARTTVAAGGWFYWDDLTLFAAARRAGVDGLAGLAATVHDGHLMPLGWLVFWLLAHAAPLQWPAAVGVLAVLNLCAAGCVAWACRKLCPGAVSLGGVVLPVAALPTAAYLLTPLTLTSTTWLANAVNVLPVHAALAAAIGLGVRHVRGEHRAGRATRGPAACGRAGAAGAAGPLAVAGVVLLGCLFSERMLLAALAVPVFLGAWVLTAGRNGRAGDGAAGGRWARVGSVGLAVVAAVAVWAAIYAVIAGDPRTGQTGAGAGAVFARGYFKALVPTLAGAPWSWTRWHPGPPVADPTVAATIAGLVVLAALLAWSGRRAVVWAVALAYPAIPLAALVVARSGPETAPEITQTLRHFSETAVLLAAALAVALSSRSTAAARADSPAAASESRARSDRSGHPDRRRHAPARAGGELAGSLGMGLVAGLVAVSSVVSTAGFAASWAEQPARGYVDNLRAGVAAHDGPVLDQDLPAEVLLPLVHPDNRIAALAAGLQPKGAAEPAVADWTRAPSLADAAGRVRPAGMVTLRATLPDGEEGCGTRVPGRAPSGDAAAEAAGNPQAGRAAAAGTAETGQAGPVSLPLDGPLMPAEWVVEFNYFADRDGTARLSLDGEPTEIPLQAGLHQVWVLVEGGGTRLTVDSPVELCVGRSPVGKLALTDP